jgi:phosphoglycolate phosphatase
MHEYETYLFDLDGTLTDTVMVWLGIFRDGLIECGVVPPDDRILSRYTHDWQQMLELGLPTEKLDDFIQRAHEMAIQRLPAAPLHVGAIEILKLLQNHKKRIGIYSTLDRPLLELAMEYRKLNALTDVAIAGSDVARRKPSPDGILLALNALGVSANGFASTVYIGDKDTDIQAANSAGVDGVIYYPPSHRTVYDLTELTQHHPRSVIRSWSELRESLAGHP